VSGVIHLGNLTYVSGRTEGSSQLSNVDDINVLAKVKCYMDSSIVIPSICSCSNVPVKYWRGR